VFLPTRDASQCEDQRRTFANRDMQRLAPRAAAVPQSASRQAQLTFQNWLLQREHRLQKVRNAPQMAASISLIFPIAPRRSSHRIPSVA